jgi:hypothetical protein
MFATTLSLQGQLLQPNRSPGQVARQGGRQYSTIVRKCASRFLRIEPLDESGLFGSSEDCVTHTEGRSNTQSHLDNNQRLSGLSSVDSRAHLGHMQWWCGPGLPLVSIYGGAGTPYYWQQNLPAGLSFRPRIPPTYISDRRRHKPGQTLDPDGLHRLTSYRLCRPNNPGHYRPHRPLLTQNGAS